MHLLAIRRSQFCSKYTIWLFKINNGIILSTTSTTIKHFTTNNQIHENWFKKSSRSRIDPGSLPSLHDFNTSKNGQDPDLGFSTLLKNQQYDLIMENYYNHDPQFINDIIEKTIEPCPQLFRYESESEIEIPRYKAYDNSTERLPIDYRFYNHIYSKIPKLYDFCKHYETIMFKNEFFFQKFIWLCFHMNDLPKLQHLAFGKNQYSYKTWAYLLSAFIQNYEIDFAKSIFQKLCKNQLDCQLLEITLMELVEVDCLFEHLKDIFERWIDHELQVSPQSLGIMLEQYHKYGTKEELENFQQFLIKNDFNRLYNIEIINLQFDIINQSKNNKKTITNNHLLQFKQISKKVPPNELSNYYYNWLRFLIKYSNIEMIELLIIDLKHHNLEINDKIQQLICEYYTNHDKFLQLFKLFKTNSIKFNEIYLYNLFDSFIKTYPYHAPNFQAQFHQWIDNSDFSKATKTRLKKKLSIIKINSQITPYNINLSPFINKPKKYLSIFWKDIPWNSNVYGKILKDQVSYRINKGFLDIVRKGVRPDNELIIKTFRRSDMNNKKILIDLLKTIRTYSYNKIKYDLYILQGNQTKENLHGFYLQNDLKDFTTNDKIMFSRMLMNKGLYEETNAVLSSIYREDLTDKTKMIKFIIQLRNYTSFGKYAELISTIENFPIDEIILSPYILNQCVFIEKKLKSKQNHNQTDNIQLKLAIKKLRGLIGDIDLRLDRDSVEISKTILQMFKFLDNWACKTETENQN